MKLYELCGSDTKRSFSPFCWRIKYCLAHKNIKAETVPITFTQKNKLSFSGQDKVPIIEDNKNIIFDSWNIMNYLDHKYPLNLLGLETETLFIKYWTENIIHPIILSIIALDIHSHLSSSDQKYFRSSREKRFGKSLEEYCDNFDRKKIDLFKSLTPFRSYLNHDPFLGGNKPNASDYILNGAFMWARNVSDKKIIDSKDPILDWRKRMLDLFDGLGKNSLGFEIQ